MRGTMTGKILEDHLVSGRLETGEEIGTIHARDEAAARECVARVLSAFTVSREAVEPPPLVHGWYGG